MSFPSTFTDLQTAVLAAARMDPNKTSDVTAVKDAINAAYSEAIIETEANVTSATMALTAGSYSYTLPSAIVRIKAIFDTTGGAQYSPLRGVSIDKILQMRVAAGGASATTGAVEYYAVLGLTELEVYPTPGGDHTLTVYYVKQPTALSAGSDVPILEEPYATNLLTYGALADVGVGDLKGDPRTDAWAQQYEYWVTKHRAHLQLKKGGQPGQFEFTPDRGYPPHDPSTIPAWNG